MKFIKYHKIRQFKDIIRDINFTSNYKGQGSDGKPMFGESKKPILKFTGTVKLHGTNAGICYTPEKGIVAQKRSSLINPGDLTAHFDFNRFVQVTCKKELTALMSYLYITYCKNDNEQITLYGEWAGKGIQKGIGISELDKAFYFFDCIVYNEVTEEERWVDIKLLKPRVPKVNNIYGFPVYTQIIDFNNPGLVQNDLINITNEVEKECPVSKLLGISGGIGEGIVWTTYWKNTKYIFKVKGEKHSTSKVEKLASVDPEVVKNIMEFVEYACTPNRIEQGIKETEATEKKHTPDLLRWVANDIISEEDDVLKANNLEWKQVAKEVSNRIRQHFFILIDKI